MQISEALWERRKVQFPLIKRAWGLVLLTNVSGHMFKYKAGLKVTSDSLLHLFLYLLYVNKGIAQREPDQVKVSRADRKTSRQINLAV